MLLNEMVCPEGTGDETYIEAIHESVVESSRKLHIHFVRFLINSSKMFKRQLTERLWGSLMVKTAEYRYDEYKQVDESVLKEKVLGLRVLSEAYRMTLE